MSNNANIWEVGGGQNATSYMPVAGGTFTGDVLGITKPKGDNSTSFATTAFVYAAIVALGMGTLGLQNANAVSITGGTIDGTSIGATTPASGKFSTLNSTGATSLGATSATGIDNTPIGATTPSSGIFSNLKNNATLPAADNSTNAATTAWTVANFVKPNTAVSFSALDNTPIGGTAPAAGSFTSASVTSSTARFQATSNTNHNNAGYRFTGLTQTGVSQNAGLYFTPDDSGGIANIGLWADDATNGAKLLRNGNFQVGSGADTGDKFQVFGRAYSKNSGAFNRFYLGSDVDGDTGYEIQDAAGHYKLGINIGGAGSGSFNLYNFTNARSTFVVDQATDNITLAAGIKLSNGTTALNAYEEGTFTPTIAGSTTAGTPTYTNQWGSYTRVGRLMHFKLRISLSAVGGMVGNITIAGLPHNAANDGYISSSFVSYYNGVTLGSGYTLLSALHSANANSMTLYESGSGINPSTLACTALSASTDIIITGTYTI